MESLQQQYWAQYEEAGELFMHGSIQEGRDLCLDLRRQVKMGLYLRAMVNAALAIFSDNEVDKSDYATECLDLASMLHEQAPDNETTWLVKHAQDLKDKIEAQIEKERGDEMQDSKDDPEIVKEYFGSPTEGEKPNISWEGMFTTHWKAAKQAQQDLETKDPILDGKSETATSTRTKGGMHGGITSPSPEPTAIKESVEGTTEEDAGTSGGSGQLKFPSPAPTAIEDRLDDNL